ncbi:MAG: SRPBCC family protein [Actinomycetes bacterium]
MTAHIAVDVVIDAPPEAVWSAVTDWPRHSEWMLGTVVRSTDLDGVGVGGGLEAFTGVGRLGFLDTMVITEWDPPRRCVVLHTGKVVKGLGIFEVVALPGGRSRFVWAEELDVPLGILGKAGWPIVRPGFAWGVGRSLQKLARDVEAEHAAS